MSDETAEISAETCSDSTTTHNNHCTSTTVPESANDTGNAVCQSQSGAEPDDIPFREKIKIFEEFSAPRPTSKYGGFGGLFRRRNQNRKGDDVHSAAGRSKKSAAFSPGKSMKSWHSSPALDEQHEDQLDRGIGNGSARSRDDHAQVGAAEGHGGDGVEQQQQHFVKKPHWTVRLTKRLNRIREVFEQKRGANGSSNGNGTGSRQYGLLGSTNANNSSSRMSLVSVFPDLAIEDNVTSPTDNSDSLPADAVADATGGGGGDGGGGGGGEDDVESQSSRPDEQAATSNSSGKCKKPAGVEKGGFIAELLLKFSSSNNNNNHTSNNNNATADKASRKNTTASTAKGMKNQAKQLTTTVDSQASSTYIEADRIDVHIPASAADSNCPTDHCSTTKSNGQCTAAPIDNP